MSITSGPIKISHTYRSSLSQQQPQSFVIHDVSNVLPQLTSIIKQVKETLSIDRISVGSWEKFFSYGAGEVAQYTSGKVKQG